MNRGKIKFFIYFILVFSFLFLLFRKPIENQTYSSYDSSPTGLKAFYMLLEKKKVPVERSEKPISLIHPQTKILLITPTALRGNEIRENEVESVFHWVSEGGHLVYFPGHYDREMKKRLDITGGITGRDNVLNDLLTMQVWGNDEAIWDKLTTQVSAKKGMECLPQGTSLQVRKGSIYLASNASYQSFLTHGGEELLGELKIGKGRVTLIADPLLFSNFGLQNKNNARFAICMGQKWKEEAGDQHLTFDEFHHGYTSDQTFSSFANTASARSLFVQALLLSLVFLWAYLPRFGKVIYPFARKERKNVEFVDSLASLYEKQSWFADCSKWIAEDWRRKFCKVSGLPLQTPFSELPRVFEKVFGRKDVLHRVEMYLSRAEYDPSFAEKTFLPFHRLIYFLRSKL